MTAIPGLANLQRKFRRAILFGDDSAIASFVERDGLSVCSRVDLYRNNVVASLTTYLKTTFPVICRLVDERFFAYAAHEYICGHPPTRACLAEYGGEFPSFLSGFEPCRTLSYLGDVARLEWLVHRAATAPEATPLPPSQMKRFANRDATRLVLLLDRAVGLLLSPWPVNSIWRANRPGASTDANIELAAGMTRVVVGRIQDEPVLWIVDAAFFTFVSLVKEGASLQSATDAAIAVDANFELTPAMRFLFSHDLVVGLELKYGD